jgi:hypothetical protein
MEVSAELDALAAEELAAARRLSWRELARVTPWGDAFCGFTANGREVEIERSYLWVDAADGDILCEVVVRDRGAEAQASCVVRRPGAA